MALLTAWTLLLAASARGQQESGWLERPTTLCYDGASAWAWDPEVVPPGTEQGWKL
jgi:hypothetical protein